MQQQQWWILLLPLHLRQHAGAPANAGECSAATSKYSNSTHATNKSRVGGTAPQRCKQTPPSPDLPPPSHSQECPSGTNLDRSQLVDQQPPRMKSPTGGVSPDAVTRSRRPSPGTLPALERNQATAGGRVSAGLWCIGVHQHPGRAAMLAMAFGIPAAIHLCRRHLERPRPQGHRMRQLVVVTAGRRVAAGVGTHLEQPVGACGLH